MEEIYGVSLGNATAQTTSNGYTFAVDSSANISYSLSGTYSTFLSGGGTSGDTAFNSVLNNGRVGSGTGVLTLNNLAQGVTYRVLFLLADTRSGVGTRTFSITQGSSTSPSESFAFAGGTPSLGGYILYTFTATGMTQAFTVNNSYGHQLNGLLVCCVGANTPFKTIEAEWGTLGGGATIVSLPAGTLPTSHTEALEASGRSYVHLASVGDSITLTNKTSIIANTLVIRACIPDAPSGGGITASLDLYINGTAVSPAVSLNSTSTWIYNGWTDNTPGDGAPQRFFDETRVLLFNLNPTFTIPPGATITLKKSSGDTATYYDIDCVDLENAPAVLTQPGNTLSVTAAPYNAVSGPNGMTFTSLAEPYAYVDASPALGAYALCTFTATGSTATFTTGQSPGLQMNAVLVGKGGTPPSSPQYTTGTFTNNSVLTQVGSTSNEVYGVSLGNSTAQTTANGYSFAVDSSANISYSVSGTASGLLGGGGTSGDASFDSVLSHARAGSGAGTLLLKNLTSGTTYQVLFLMADTRSGVGTRNFTVTEGIINATAFNNCINDALAAGKNVWIPAGTFYLDQQLVATNTTGHSFTISGAGEWYTTLFRDPPLNTVNGVRTKIQLSDANISDIYIDGNSIGRFTPEGADAGVNEAGTVSWLVQKVWVHNETGNFWLGGTHGTLQNCRSACSWADGINFGSNGVSGQGVDMVIQNNFIRGNCDDGIALNQQNGLGASGNLVGAQILNNTSVAGCGANGLAVYGGRSTIIANNLVCDPTEGNGLDATTFGAAGNPLESALFEDNVVIRAPGYKAYGGIFVAANANPTFTGNIDTNALKAGIALQSSTATFQGNLIDHPANQGIWVISGNSGSATFDDNILVNLNAGQHNIENDSPSTFTITESENTGF